jgi:hypothetical protein
MNHDSFASTRGFIFANIILADEKSYAAKNPGASFEA